MLSRPLKLDYEPVTRMENYCAIGSEELLHTDGHNLGGAPGECVSFVGVVVVRSTQSGPVHSRRRAPLADSEIPLRAILV